MEGALEPLNTCIYNLTRENEDLKKNNNGWWWKGAESVTLTSIPMWQFSHPGSASNYFVICAIPLNYLQRNALWSKQEKQFLQWMWFESWLVSTNLVLEFPRVSSRSSEPHSSWIRSPSHGFTIPAALLPNANSSEITSDIGISAVWSEPAAMAGEQVPLWPGVHMREPPPFVAASLKPNGLVETRLNVGELGPPWGILRPANHSGLGTIWRPGLGGVEDGREE